jgi:hypothetical protein
MGRARNPSTTADVFSRASTRERSSPSVKPPSSPATTDAAATAPSPRLVLPSDLPSAIKRLEDQDLDRLLSVAFSEQQRRGRKSPMSARKRRVEAVPPPLTQGKLNAVRAAFKAGVSPTKIARQFGLSQSDVRKALASDRSSRSPLVKGLRAARVLVWRQY